MADTLTSGAIVDGRYRLQDRLGEGTFGEVFRALDTRLADRAVAVKFLKPEFLDQPGVVARFEAEANALALLQHPNVVGVLDRGDWGGRRYLVTEFVHGVTLNAWLERFRARGTPPPLDLARTVFDQICAGVEAAHQVRAPSAIVHRDLKPDNVIVREPPSGELTPKVLDFGIAQLGGRQGTRTGVAMGTPLYMAPEQALGDSSGVGPWTDVFALAVIYVEVLTLNAAAVGEQPFWGVSLRSHARVRALLDERRPEVPAAIWDILARALHPEGADRFPDAGALRRALQQAAALTTPPAWAASASGSVSPFARTAALEALPAPVTDFTPVQVPGAGTNAAASRGGMPATMMMDSLPTFGGAGTSPSTFGGDAGNPTAPGFAPGASAGAGASGGGAPASRTVAMDMSGFALGAGPFGPGPGAGAGAGVPPHGNVGSSPGSNPGGFAPQPGPFAPGVGGPGPAHGQSGTHGGFVPGFTPFGQTAVPATPVRTDGSKAFTYAVIGTLVAALCGVFAYRAVRPDPDDAPAHAPGVAMPLQPGQPGVLPTEAAPPGAAQQDSPRVPVGDSPTLGSPAALVTIVEFSEFQCPFCNRVRPTIDELRRRYGSDLRVVWKNNPLAFHQNAQGAAEAAMEAYAQGGGARFWQMHDVLFQNQQALARPDLERYAAQLGLDVARFRAALDAGVHRAAIARDQALAATVGLQGTPSFLVNGTPVIGAQPLERFIETVDRVLAQARTIAPRNEAYARMVASPLPGAEGTAPRPSPPTPPADTSRHAIPVEGAPAHGEPDALVTIVEFSEFQCPFCSRVQPTLAALRERYGRDLRIVWRNQPLAFHQHAQGAAEAAMEAYAQGGAGRFWQMHDLLFQNQQSLTRPDLERYAAQVGLNLARFRAALDRGVHRAAIARDQALASQHGANGTPTFFINGRVLTGAQPLEAFTARVDEELARARALLATPGVTRANVYTAATREGAAP